MTVDLPDIESKGLLSHDRQVRNTSKSIFLRLKRAGYYGLLLGIFIFTLRLLLHRRFRNERSRSNIVIYNGVSYHDEVYAAFVEALGQSSEFNTTAFIAGHRYGMERIIKPMIQPSSFSEVAKGNASIIDHVKDLRAKAFIDVTCGDDIGSHRYFYEQLLNKTNATLFCVIHHAERLRSGRLNRLLEAWQKAGRLHILTLSEHVQLSAQRYWQEKAQNTPIDYFVPVFDPYTGDPGDHEISFGLPEGDFISVQGNFESSRRNYSALFDGMLQKAEVKPVKLALVGHGKLRVPEAISDAVIQFKGLVYTSYYELLQCSSVMVTAFASDDYFHNKASSTVAASVIAAVPVVASERLLQAYTYLERDLVIPLLHERDNEIEAARRFLDTSKEQQSMLKERLKAHRGKLISENARKLQDWVRSLD